MMLQEAGEFAAHLKKIEKDIRGLKNATEGEQPRGARGCGATQPSRLASESVRSRVSGLFELRLHACHPRSEPCASLLAVSQTL